jgi:hypothetical protein
VATSRDALRSGYDWLVTALDQVADRPPTSVDPALLDEPVRLQATLTDYLVGMATSVIVTGTHDRRLLLMERAGGRSWLAADLSGRPHVTRTWPTWACGRIDLSTPDRWLSDARLTREAVDRLTRPRVLLVALYHPEFFPLPRFPLGISDLARAARAALLGQVELMDMQLGATLDDVIEAVRRGRHDILGVSATFGQHDLMIRLLDEVANLAEQPLVLAGGSLTARTERILLERYPKLMVARGAGEPTMQDILAFWHGDLEIAEVRGVGYVGAPQGEGTIGVGRFRRTGIVANRLNTDIFPELDLLDATFRHKGVAQLESSRGCTNYCSFCPRGHKGTWAGTTPEELSQILRAMGAIFDRHPEISRTIYLVDEEFIGRSTDAVPRALAVANTVHAAGFRWETSCRVDQVVRLDRDRAWHVERGQMWRELVARGLRRCLFGVESGVTSILQRFNKETTGEQNAIAIRTLCALGVPTRFTYITFDHLMSEAELRASYAFQARTDLLLEPVPHLSVQAIVDGVRDQDFVAAHTTGRPFYSTISYMLVSMECLIGAAYTRLVQAAGLAGAPQPSMGRIDADFADWRIGRCSRQAQLWIDRNIALDYTLKSLEKLLDGRSRHVVREARVVIKDAAFSVLGQMLHILDEFSIDRRHANAESLDDRLTSMMNTEISELQDRMDVAVAQVAPALPPAEAALLRHEHRRWVATSGWQLINASDPCGT